MAIRRERGVVVKRRIMRGTHKIKRSKVGMGVFEGGSSQLIEFRTWELARRAGSRTRVGQFKHDLRA